MPNYTRRHYVPIAEALRNAEPPATSCSHVGWEYTLDALCAVFRADNPQFDATRFREAATSETTHA